MSVSCLLLLYPLYTSLITNCRVHHTHPRPGPLPVRRKKKKRREEEEKTRCQSASINDRRTPPKMMMMMTIWEIIEGTREEYCFASVIAAWYPRVAIESVLPTRHPLAGWVTVHTLGRVTMIFRSGLSLPCPPSCLSLLFRPSSHSREVEESERSRPVDDISSIFTTHEIIYHEIRTIVF